MDAIFMNTKNIKISDSNVLILHLTYKMDLWYNEEVINMLFYQILP